MKQRLRAICVLLACLPGGSVAGEKDGGLPVLRERHVNDAGTLRFQTPPGWTVSRIAGVPEVTEARGDGLLLRVVWREGEVGLDALHVDCMDRRLTPPGASRPDVEYDYDFLGSALGNRRALHSAFVVHYDQPVDGSAVWRQANVTVVGDGESACIIGYGPLPAANKSRRLGRLLDAVMQSVEFRPWR